MFESLERRQLLTAVLSSAEPGLLIVYGTLSSDTLTITKLNDGRIRVDQNGTLKNFAGADVTKIFVDAGHGHDTVTVSTAISLPTTLIGSEGNDSLRGGNGPDSIFGAEGNDDLNGRGGADYISGETGDDLIRGGSGNDSLYGDAGSDSLYGGSGTDLLKGGDNSDVLVAVGGGQSDSIEGNSGTDNYWVDSESTEVVTSSNVERAFGRVHRISKFKDLNIHHGFLNDETTAVSRNLNGQNLPDPLATNATFVDAGADPLFSPDGPRMTDIIQGQVDDCYFLVALAAVAKVRPSFITRHAVDLGDGTFAVRFKGIFGEEYVRVDADLPTDSDTGVFISAARGNNSIWVPIWEKAFAFFRRNEGTYASIGSGNPGEGFDALGVQSDFFIPFGDQNGLMNRIRDDVAAGRAVVGGTKDTLEDATAPLIANHAYVVDQVQTNANGTVTAIVLYNPHGRDDAGNDADTSDGFVTVTPQQMMANFESFNSATAA